MQPVIKKFTAAITGTDSTGVKAFLNAAKTIRVLDAIYWVTGTEATALVIKIDDGANEADTAGTNLGTITLGAANNQYKQKSVDLAGAEIARGRCLVVRVSTASTATKNGTIEINYIEDEQLVDSLGDARTAAS